MARIKCIRYYPQHDQQNSMPDFVTVAKVGSIPLGQGATYPLGDRLVAVFNHDGRYFAIDDLCPHMGASLGAGHVDDEGKVSCPWHAWRFDICDGTWCDNPRLKIDAFEVRIEGDEIQVALPAMKQAESPADSASSESEQQGNSGQSE